MTTFLCSSRRRAFLLLPVIALLAGGAFGQASPETPGIGYVYPAGAQRGATVQISVGGQRLRGVRSVWISPSDGIEAAVVRHYRPARNLDQAQRRELQRRFESVRAARMAEGAGETPGDVPEWDSSVDIPPHPLFDGLKDFSLRELEHVRALFMNVSRRQPNAQIAETVLIEISVAADATPGNRQLRLVTPGGVTNPLEFRVGVIPETREFEPNDPGAQTDAPPEPPLEMPVTINGQIMPGDVDRFELAVKKGQRLVFRTEARSLVPYLADAVPGWFQPVLALYDPAGREVAFADDYRFDPDPVLFFEAPRGGVYTIEIRDSIYRGREDFVYRLSAGELPFITSFFPLGCRAGGETSALVAGPNLPASLLPLEAPDGAAGLRETTLRKDGLISNPVCYAVNTLPELEEVEPNGKDSPQQVALPCIINGRIGRSGDVDVFEFDGAAGEEIVAEVMARRLGSPLDSILRITDAADRVIAWNDDFEWKGSGLLTHHADSYVRVKLPETGTYRAVVGDVQQRGGHEFAYRLRLSRPRPDFELRAAPSGLGLPAGGVGLLTIHTLRKDGFDGEIELVLTEPTHGFRISGGRAPAGSETVRISLTAPRRPPAGPVALRIEGRARIDGETVARKAVPADHQMQAFAYMHLVPALEFVVSAGGRQPWPPVRLTCALPVPLVAGGGAVVSVETPPNPELANVRLRLNDPPEGVTLGEVRATGNGLEFELKADSALQPGLADNLIVDVHLAPVEDGAPRQAAPRAGMLPAIPFKVVAAE